MFLTDPGPTRYDVHFDLFGFAIRIHPLFWLGCLITGASGSDGQFLIVWTAVCFVSILIHELGHALMMRRFGRSAHIVLHLMGGLAIEGSGNVFDPMSYRTRHRTPYEQILISFAGPAAGFSFAAAIALLVVVAGGIFELNTDFPVFWRFALREEYSESNRLMYQMLHSLFYVNIYWGLMNLLPVLPLDGGQIARQLMIVNDPWHGNIRAHWLSVFAAGGVVVFAASSNSSFLLMMFLSLGVSNYMAIQQFGGMGRGGRW